MALCSIIIILVTSFYLNNLNCRNFFLVLLFLIKGICVVFFMLLFLKYILSIISILIIYIIFLIYSFKFQTKLDILKNNQNNMGIGDWVLGIGDWGLGIGPNPQSPIPNPQSPIPK